MPKSKLTGKSSLSLTHVPQPNHQKLGLIKGQKYITKSYRLSAESVDLLEQMICRFEEEAGFKIAAGKVIERLIDKNKDWTLKDLVKEK